LNALKYIAFLFLFALTYLLLWPVDIEPETFSAQPAPTYQGDYEVNHKLADFESLTLLGDRGPEGIASNHNYLFAATESGNVLRWPKRELGMHSPKPEVWINTGGRPLGIAVGPKQSLWVADAFEGLIEVTPNAKVISRLTMVDGTPIVYANDVAIAPNNKLYLTDSTTRHSAKAYQSTYAASLSDILEHGDSGRLIEYDIDTGSAKVIASGYSFINGIAVSIDGSYLVFAETSTYKIHKLWLNGERAGKREVIIDNLPGFPDNIYRAPNEDRFWVGFTSPRKAIVDRLADKPWARKIIHRLPSFVRPKASLYGHVIAFDGHGVITQNLQDPAAGYPLTTGALEVDDYLYISSLTADSLARVKIADYD